MNKIGLNFNKNFNFKSVQDAQIQENSQLPSEQSLPEAQLPQVYNVPETTETPTLVEEVKKYDMMGLIYPWIEHPIAMVGTCGAMAYGVEKFSQACGGEYEKSLVGKAANLGDKVENSKFVKSKPVQAIAGAGKKVIGSIKHFFRNSDLLNAIFNTPSQPEWQMPRDEMLGMPHRVIHEFNNTGKTLKWTEDGFTKLTDLGLNKNDKKFLKDFFGDVKLSLIEEKASNAIRLKRIGVADDAIRSIIEGASATDVVKTKELEFIGLDKEFLKKIEKNAVSLEDIRAIERACDKGRNIKIGAGHKSWLGPFQIFEREACLAEYSNRLKSMLDETITKTGRAFSTFLQKCHRGFTFGGHKMNVIFFVSPLLVETMMDVKKAERNEKLGTAAHGAIHAVSWVFTFPLALKAMHHIGGMQYAGMSKEDVAEYRKLINEFNEKANPFKEKSWKNIFGIGERKTVKEEFFQSYDEYDTAYKELKKKLKDLRNKNSKNQNLITKIGKQIGKFLTIDLETISNYKNGVGGVKNITRTLSNFSKNVLGIPMRFILWGAITMGLFDTVINKGIKGCFGNFYDRFKEEEFVNAKKEQKKFLKEDLKVRLNQANQRKVYGMENPAVLGDFSNENIASLAPSINTQRPKNNKTKDNQPMQNEQKINLENNENKTLEENQIVQSQEDISPQEETMLSKALNSETSDVENKEQNFNKYNSETLQNNDSDVETFNIVKDDYTYIPSSNPIEAKNLGTQKRDNYTYIPSSENVLKTNTKAEDVQKYIPSQIGAKFNKTFDNSRLDAVLHRADLAEQRAIQTLAGNFDFY